MKVVLSEHFRKMYRRLSETERDLFKKKLATLVAHGYSYPSLRIHKLSGKLEFIWSLSVNLRVRALFYRQPGADAADETIEFFSIGGHEVYT